MTTTTATNRIAPRMHYRSGAPTISDDVTLYNLGDMWVDTVTKDMYRLDDDTTGAAAWTDVGASASSHSFTDTDFRIIGSSDATKKLAFEVDGVATGVVCTIVLPANVANRSYNLPLIAADDTIAVIGTAQSWSATQTHTAPIITAATIAGAAGVRLPHGTAPTSPTNGDLWTTTAGIFVRINGTTVGPLGAGGGSTLTSTYVGYGDGANAITGESAFNYNATTNTLAVDNVTVIAANINGVAGTERYLEYQTAGLTRWRAMAGNAAEGGSNAGSSYIIRAFADDGTTIIDSPIIITRAAGGSIAVVRPITTTKQITSTLAIGTAPFVVTSTTLVNNLYVAKSALADTVTTNANLTGPINSSGNTTAVTAQTGSGSTFVMNMSPTLVTPVIGVASGTSLTLSTLNATYVTYGGASGILTNDSAFLRTSLVLSIDVGADNTLITGYGKLGFASGGTSTAFYLAQTTNYNSTDYAIKQINAGSVTVNAPTGATLNFANNNSSKVNLTSTIFTSNVKFQVGSTIQGDASDGAINVLNGGARFGGTVYSTSGYTGTSGTFSLLNPTSIIYAGTGGILTSAAGFINSGTISATAPSVAISAPGNLNGIIYQGNGASCYFVSAVYANSAGGAVGLQGYVAEGTAASPGATIVNDRVIITLRGHDGTDHTAIQGQIDVRSGGTWSPTSRPTYIRFSTTPSASTTLTAAFTVDDNQVLVSSSSISVATFSAGTLRPHIQLGTTSSAFGGIAQVAWQANALGVTHVLAKSRSGTVSTQGVANTGDTLGTISWQTDDGTNFIPSAQIQAVVTGTIATGQAAGSLRIATSDSTGSMNRAITVDSTQTTIFSPSSSAASSALYTAGTYTPSVQIHNAGSTAGAGLALTSYRNSNTIAPTIIFSKARSNTYGTMTVITTADTLGTLDWQASDGTNFVSAVQIIVTCTGTIASNQIPGNLVIKTANASGTLTTAFTIDNAQAITAPGAINFTGTVVSSSSTTGNVINGGGEAIAGACYIGGAGTVTTSLPALNVTQTWNASGVTFTGIKVNITNTASQAASMIVDFQVGGASMFNITRVGGFTTASGATINGTVIGNAYQFQNGQTAFVTSVQIYRSNTAAGAAPFDAAGNMVFQTASGSVRGFYFAAGSSIANVFIISGAGVITHAEGGDLNFGTTTGSKLATTVSQKMGLWGVTPIVQPAGANQAALTDSTTGTAGFTLNDVGLAFSQSAINNNFASIARLLDNMRTAMVNFGSMKGAA